MRLVMAWLRWALTLIVRLFGHRSNTSIASGETSAPLPAPALKEPSTKQELVTPSTVDSAGVSNHIPDLAFKHLDYDKLTHVVVHHCSLAKYHRTQNPFPVDDFLLDAKNLIRAFTTHEALGTGLQVPYHVMIGVRGDVSQLLPFSARGSHARSANSTSLALCLVGENEPAGSWQYAKAVQCAVAMLAYIGKDQPALIGHFEVPNGSKDKGKRCPEPTINMVQFRRDVASRLPPDLRNWTIDRRMKFARNAGFVTEI